MRNSPASDRFQLRVGHPGTKTIRLSRTHPDMPMLSHSVAVDTFASLLTAIQRAITESQDQLGCAPFDGGIRTVVELPCEPFVVRTGEYYNLQAVACGFVFCLALKTTCRRRCSSYARNIAAVLA